MNITTSIIRIRAFSPRKLITYPAVLKMKLTIEPMRPWRIPATLPPRVLKPFPTPLTTNLRPFVSALTTTPLCSDCEYKDVSHSLLAKCLQVLFSHSKVNQTVLFPQPPFLMLVLLLLDFRSHHHQSHDFLN